MRSINAQQIRAARAILDWSQDDLAAASGVSVATIRKLETGHMSPRAMTTDYIRLAIERAGLELIDPDGVRRRPHDVTIHTGVHGLNTFFEDMRRTAPKASDIVLVVNDGWTHVADFLGHPDFRAIGSAEVTAPARALTTEAVGGAACGPGIEWRSISRNFVDLVPFCVYGAKSAIIEPNASDFRLTVFSSLNLALALRRQFQSIWDKATPLLPAGGALSKTFVGLR